MKVRLNECQCFISKYFSDNFADRKLGRVSWNKIKYDKLSFRLQSILQVTEWMRKCIRAWKVRSKHIIIIKRTRLIFITLAFVLQSANSYISPFIRRKKKIHLKVKRYGSFTFCGSNLKFCLQQKTCGLLTEVCECILKYIGNDESQKRWYMMLT